jgi:lipid-binding SYLF domain-containing protein
MKTKFTLTTIFIIIFSMTGFSQENDVDKAKQAIAEFSETDPDISKFFNSAYGYAIFPGIGKGGLGIGGAGGKGTVFKGGTPVADTKMSQLTIGFQAGGQKYAEVIFFENAKAYDRFVGNNFEFAAQVSAVALKAGVSADAEYRDGMVVFTYAIGGLMYEASVGGQKFKTEMY